MKILYRQKAGWFVGHVQEYPEYESQGETLEELKDNLIEIYHDIANGLVYVGYE
jgi:predicted RNase H-like HicB family nuclease